LRHVTHRKPWDVWQRRSPPLQGGRGPEPWDKQQRRSPPWHGGEDRSYRTRGNTGALLDREARSEVVGHVAAPEPASTGRRDPVV
jgi:hypothetical protein